MQNTKPDNLIIGYTPELMQEMGMPSLPFVIGTGHVYSAAKTEAEAKQDGNYRKGVHYHGLGADVVKNIYEQLQDPVMIIAAKDVNKNAAPLRSTHSVVAIVDIGKAGSSLLLPVEITAERSVGGQRMDVNVLSSVYTKKVASLVDEAIAMENSGDVGIYYAKKEATNLIGAGVQFPVQLQAQMAPNPIIRSFDAKVNRNISDATQSQQFKRWFGDWQNHPESASKVVNEDGTPRVMYHGTNADFWTFDLGKSGQNFGDVSDGLIFFTNKKDGYQDSAADYARKAAENGGKERIVECYLDIKKPLRLYSDGAYTPTAYFDQNAESIYSQYLSGDYDGIIIENSDKSVDDSVIYMVDDPTQIKSATDNIGTFDGTNPDIRYSKRVTDKDTVKFLEGSADRITVQDTEELQKIGRKSVNDFTGDDIRKTEKWARKFYRELGTKSPFFRAWFGDWRAYDKTKITVADTQGQNRGIVKNRDTNWDVQVSGKVFNETIAHKNQRNVSAQPYLPYINSIVENAVLLDTVTIPTGKEKSANSAWMHTLYAVADAGKGKKLLKLYVEELNDVNSDGTIRRAYQLQNIEKWQLSAKGSGTDSLASSISAANVESIADIYAIVKSKDASFSPHPVNPALLNVDGTPKVFYHGAKKNGGFSVFRPWQYFTDHKNYAERYAERGNDNSLYAVYLRANKVFDTRDAEARRVFESIRQEYGLGELQDTGLPDWTDGYDISNYLDEHPELGYDAVVLDEGGDLVEGEPVSRGESIVIKDSTQIKSATDNIGTFDRTNPDIHYSRRGKTALETYTEKQYNAFGWASYGNVISPAEREILLSRYADFKHTRDQYPVTPWGEAVIHSADCPDVILYVKGSIRCPEITRVVRINSDNSTDVAIIRERIIENEFERVLLPYDPVTDYYGEKILQFIRKRDHASFRSYQDAVRKGRSRQTGDTSGERLQDGERSRAGGENGDRTDDGVKRRSTRDYSYKALTEKPDMTLTVLGGQIPGNRADIVALAKKNAAKVGKFDPYTGSVSVYVNDIDTDVLLSTDGLKHGLRRTKDIRANVNALVTLQAGEIIKNSIRVNELVPSKQNASGSFVLIGSARDGDGHLYVVRSVINQFELTSMDVLYAMNAKRAEPAALNAPRSATMSLSVTDSTQKDPAALNAPRVSTPRYQSSISIADLLDVVNRNFPDILPESVLRHFGHTERPGGDLGESALFSKRGTSNRALLVNALNSAVSSDIEQERLTQYRKSIDMLDAEQKKLAGLRAEIRTLSFAEGKRDKAALKALQDEATRTENRITNYDRRLLNLEATAPLKALLLRERTKARKAAEQRGKEALAEYRLKAQLDLSYAIQKNINARDSHARTVMRQKIRRVVSELNQLLLNGTKDRHVMIDWQKSAAEALAAVNMDTLSADSRLEALAQKIDEATDPAVREKLQATYARLEEQNDNMNQRLDALRKAYDGIRGSEDPLIQNAYHPEIDDRIKSLRDQVGDTPLRDMTKEQLQEVYDTYRMVLTTIRNANKAFKAARGESIAQLGEAVKREVLEAGGAKDKRAKLIKRFDRFYWDGMKPVYAFKAIGSKTLSGLFDNVRAGEDTWAVDVNEARDFFRESAKKHGYKSWNFDERYPFVSKSGKEFSLSLGQMLSLYAYSKREQAAPHLEEGGFVFDGNIEVVEKHKGIPVKYEINTADAYRLSRDTLAEIVGTLTDEQIAFVDDMQGYLSDTMAEKGNEVALTMYGVKLFGEKNYFPLKTAGQFKFESSSPAGEVRLRNAGFTQKTVDHATSPILLNDFMTVWGNHVNDMSMYHAFVLPIEDFNRVFNYAPYTQNADREAVKQYIENAYGKQPAQYIHRLLTDINGGARIDPTADLPNRMLGMFKKSAVFASASVVVQQPSAIARAFALVDPKYFATKPFSVKQHSAEWAEVKKYAPVAVIKEMGYFDTNMGKSTVDYITAAEYSGFKEKAAALIKDSGYRDEVLSKAHGVTKEKIAAIITHVGMYVGRPKAWAVFRLAQAVWNEETSAETAKERYQNRIFFPVGAPNDAFAAYFIGQSYIAPVSTAQVPVFNVTFEPGCRNNRHIHHAKSGGGQLLICVGGRGFYQKWGKPPVEMTPGTVVNIPAGVKHWHGAAADEWFSHLAVEVPGEETRNEWLEAVDDGQYLHAVQPEKAE